MSNTCNAPGCKNDRRSRLRYIVMPHVWELKFHRPRPDEYEKWQEKLERKDYKVGRSTMICSNHFKYGKPIADSHVPCLYIRGYPEWAVPKCIAIDMLKRTVSDQVICEIMAHMMQCIQPTVAMSLAKQYFDLCLEEQNSCSALGQHILRMDEIQLRTVARDLATHVPNGKVLEALAVYHYGITFDGTSLVSPRKRKRKHPEVKGPHLSLHALEFHNYSGSQPSIDFHNYAAKPASAVPQPKPSPCTKISCQLRVEELENKIKSLTEQVVHLEGNNESLQEENIGLKEEVQISKRKIKRLEKKVQSKRVIIEIKESAQL